MSDPHSLRWSDNNHNVMSDNDLKKFEAICDEFDLEFPHLPRDEYTYSFRNRFFREDHTRPSPPLNTAKPGRASISRDRRQTKSQGYRFQDGMTRETMIQDSPAQHRLTQGHYSILLPSDSHSHVGFSTHPVGSQGPPSVEGYGVQQHDLQASNTNTGATNDFGRQVRIRKAKKPRYDLPAPDNGGPTRERFSTSSRTSDPLTAQPSQESTWIPEPLIYPQLPNSPYQRNFGEVIPRETPSLIGRGRVIQVPLIGNVARGSTPRQQVAGAETHHGEVDVARNPFTHTYEAPLFPESAAGTTRKRQVSLQSADAEPLRAAHRRTSSSTSGATSTAKDPTPRSKPNVRVKSKQDIATSSKDTAQLLRDLGAQKLSTPTAAGDPTYKDHYADPQAARSRLERTSDDVKYHKVVTSDSDDLKLAVSDEEIMQELKELLFASVLHPPKPAPTNLAQEKQNNMNRLMKLQYEAVKEKMSDEEHYKDLEARFVILIDSVTKFHTMGVPRADLDTKEIKKTRFKTKNGHVVEPQHSFVTRIIKIANYIRDNKYVAIDVLKGKLLDDLVYAPDAYDKLKQINWRNNRNKAVRNELGKKAQAAMEADARGSSKDNDRDASEEGEMIDGQADEQGEYESQQSGERLGDQDEEPQPDENSLLDEDYDDEQDEEQCEEPGEGQDVYNGKAYGVQDVQRAAEHEGEMNEPAFQDWLNYDTLDADGEMGGSHVWDSENW